MIDKSSRYAKTPHMKLEDAEGEKVEMLELRLVPVTTAVFHHTPIEGERLDHLGHLYFRDARKFWKICDATDFLDPFDVLVPGRRVRIPPNK